MIQFILNKTEINTALPPGMLVLDFIRYHQQLTGTKIGCREGDCGACTVLVGEIKNDVLIYTSATSCLMAIGNAQGKHIVTIEGINGDCLNTVQQAFSDEGATQCGFCTPGFIVSLTGFCMSSKIPSYDNAVDAVNGNICRCTGYKSIERAAKKINEKMMLRQSEEALQFAVTNNIIPAYFLKIKERLLKITLPVVGQKENADKFLGGGTDLYVQQPESMVEKKIDFLFDKSELKGIIQRGNVCEMGGATTATDILESKIFTQHFPLLQKHIKLISSTQIRNMATIAGNFSNASPIGDFTIFFLALNAQLILSDGENKRAIALRKFYKSYKTLDKKPEEFIEKIYFELPGENDFFNFEKVSKRTNLDIASVNTALAIRIEDNIIITAGIAAGGVGPIPAYLSDSSNFLTGKKISAQLINELTQIAQTEIAPITDARGTAEYKRFLLTQLIKAHFIVLFPALPLQNLVKA
ncbi:MAG: FAD binding domain-containing protein [Ferruginibacter sp.]